eukprot:TRINITY_DN29473_c1_g2_i1.p2 TRINITY_DN29473_c1_g2~~TRINITY_DN29473_c1_g2_i1.p2  ORF type:complete len:162 (+),score=74.55 TRINITY_DN29473_c1_g2_i1:53-487(+)
MHLMRAVLIACAVLAATAAERKGTSQHLWQDTETTTVLWRLCSSGQANELRALLNDQPEAVHTRSSDGRGPLWWAFENKQDEVAQLLLEAGANPDEKDADGNKPDELTNGPGLTQWAKEMLEEKRREVDEMDGGVDEDDYGYDD